MTISVPTCPTVTILHTKHPKHDANDTGKYFFFSKEEFSNMVGYENWNRQEFEINQQGSRSWKGKVIVWSDGEFGSHGRKVTEDYDWGFEWRDWKKGDMIKLLKCSQPGRIYCIRMNLSTIFIEPHNKRVMILIYELLCIDLGMCAGNFNFYQDKGKRPPAGTPCVGSCTMKSGYWGDSYCYTELEKAQWGGECHPCRGLSYRKYLKLPLF